MAAAAPCDVEDLHPSGIQPQIWTVSSHLQLGGGSRYCGSRSFRALSLVRRLSTSGQLSKTMMSPCLGGCSHRYVMVFPSRHWSSWSAGSMLSLRTHNSGATRRSNPSLSTTSRRVSIDWLTTERVTCRGTLSSSHDSEGNGLPFVLGATWCCQRTAMSIPILPSTPRAALHCWPHLPGLTGDTLGGCENCTHLMFARQ